MAEDDITETIIEDTRLGRKIDWDPRNADFPIRAMLPQIAYKEPVSREWACRQVLDQGTEGACVGFGFTHELLAQPFPIRGLRAKDASVLYKKAQSLDSWPGDNYSGTSVLAGVKAVQELYPGTIESYRWAVSLQDVVATLGYHGPVVLGVHWYNGFYTPDKEGFIHIRGAIVGGHCILARAVDIQKNAILLHNSWGKAWGVKGMAWISFDDMARLLNESGEGCIPVRRNYWKKAKK